MDSDTEASSSEETPRDRLHQMRARIFNMGGSSDSDQGSSDEYDTDDSNTFGWRHQDRYPIRSVALNTGVNYHIANPGIINSGAVDQWITAIILKFNRRKVVNFNLLKHQEDPGKELEKVIQRVAVCASYTGRGWMRPTDDNKVKRIWTDYANVAEPEDEGLRLKLPLGERINVFHHLRPITLLVETIKCGCAIRKVRKKPLYYLRIRNRRDLEKTLSNRIPVTSFGGLINCRRCRHPYQTERIVVPDNSWVLVHEVDDDAGVNYADFQRKISFGGVGWSLGYATFSGPAYRHHDPTYFSLQFIGNRTFIYDGSRDHGSIRKFDDERQVDNGKLERVIYFRDVVQEIEH